MEFMGRYKPKERMMGGWMYGCVNRWTDDVPQVLAEYDLDARYRKVVLC
jgi:hypothetical protein